MATVGTFPVAGALVYLNAASSSTPFHSIRVGPGGYLDLDLDQARAAARAVAELDRRLDRAAAGRVAHDVGLKLPPPAQPPGIPEGSHRHELWSYLSRCHGLCLSHADLARLLELAQAAVFEGVNFTAEGQMEIPARPLGGDLNSYSDHYLVSRAIECCMHASRPLWAVVMERFGLGSTSAKHLCYRFGFSADDTKTTVQAREKAPAAQEQKSPRAEKPPLGLRPRYVAVEARIQETAEAIARLAHGGQVDLSLVYHACDLRDLVTDEVIRRNRGRA